MIVTPTRLCMSNDGGDIRTARRDFTRILQAAKLLWEPFRVDQQKHTAQGLVSTRRGRAYTAFLSFDQRRKRVRLIIGLRADRSLTPLQLRSLLKVQSRAMGLGSIAFDEESGALQVRSTAVLPDSALAKRVVPEVVRDAVGILEDDNLASLTS